MTFADELRATARLGLRPARLLIADFKKRALKEAFCGHASHRVDLDTANYSQLELDDFQSWCEAEGLLCEVLAEDYDEDLVRLRVRPK